jgi:GNAT superfamily N-acetyltransferase
MPTRSMETRPATKADYDAIVSNIDTWWGGPSTALAHPIFFYELGKLARVAELEGQMVGFLLGFSVDHTGYVHLVGIHPEHRRKGVARTMYESFERDCVALGAKRLKAITTLGNDGSLRFHEALGWTITQVADYAGPNRPRYVLTKELV